jgi:hypothetical protein
MLHHKNALTEGEIILGMLTPVTKLEKKNCSQNEIATVHCQESARAML